MENYEWNLTNHLKEQNNLNEEVSGEALNDLEERREIIKQFVDDIQKKIDEIKSQIILVIDRIEGDIAVCENRETEELINININELPEGIHEGDVLIQNNGIYEVDEKTKLEIQERIKSKIKNLFEGTEE